MLIPASASAILVGYALFSAQLQLNLRASLRADLRPVLAPGIALSPGSLCLAKFPSETAGRGTRSF